MKQLRTYWIMAIFMHGWLAQIDSYAQSILGKNIAAVEFHDIKGRSTRLYTPANQMIAFIFLSPQCPLSQNYTLVINNLQKKYTGEVHFVGVFPGKAYSFEAYRQFATRYNIKFSLLVDHYRVLSTLLDATITPEVFLLDQNRQVIYSGAIDDWVVSLGKKKSKASIHYLEDAVFASMHHQPVPIDKTKPIGCRINDI